MQTYLLLNRTVLSMYSKILRRLNLRIIYDRQYSYSIAAILMVITVCAFLMRPLSL